MIGGTASRWSVTAWVDRLPGEIASRIAVYTVLEHFDRPRKSGNCPESGKALEALACAIQIANRVIHNAAVADNSQAGMDLRLAPYWLRRKITPPPHLPSAPWDFLHSPAY